MNEKTWFEKQRFNITLRYLKTLRAIGGKVESHRTKVWKYHVHNNMTFGTDVTGTGIDPKKAGV